MPARQVTIEKTRINRVKVDGLSRHTDRYISVEVLRNDPSKTEEFAIHSNIGDLRGLGIDRDLLRKFANRILEMLREEGS